MAIICDERRTITINLKAMELSLEKEKISVLAYVLSTFAVCLLFGFIDEGAYNFAWMNNLGNWIALGIYGLSIFSFQLLSASFIFRNVRVENGKRLLSILTGTTIGVLFVVLVVFN